MSTNNICFRREIRKAFIWIPFSSGATIITLNIGTPELLTILVLKSELVHFQHVDVSETMLDEWQTV